MAKLLSIELGEKEVTPKNGRSFTLKELQDFIAHGDERTIEIVELPSGARMVVNENGKLIGLPKNEKATERWKTEYPIDQFPLNNDELIVGNALIASPKEVGEEDCENCMGEGKITTMERVYPNEPHMAPIGEETCPECGGSGLIN